MAEIKLSYDALEDLKQIKAYVAQELCNETAAINTVAGIMNNIQMLSEFPQAGPALNSIVAFDTDYRFLVCGNYTAFYRFIDNVVFIDRIIYARRDFMRILFER